MLQQLNYARYGTDPEWRNTFSRELEKAKAHVKFCCDLYAYQMKVGRHFLHEHPWSASSWKLWQVDALASNPLVHVVKSDFCRFGMEVVDVNGEVVAARKELVS